MKNKIAAARIQGYNDAWNDKECQRNKFKTIQEQIAYQREYDKAMQNIEVYADGQLFEYQ